MKIETKIKKAGRKGKAKAKPGKNVSCLILLSFVFILFSSLLLRGQECEGTQFKTDDRGLVYLKKGERAKLLIEGKWYICEGCGNCVPVESEEETQVPRQGGGQRQKRQAEDTEAILAAIEAQRKIEIEFELENLDLLAQEKLAFEDRISLMARNLKPLSDQPVPEIQGSKLKLQELAEEAGSIQDMACIAWWSLIAAYKTGIPESARELAGWGFDDFIKVNGRISINEYTPEIPVPASENPQYIAFKSIANRAGDLYTELLRLRERQEENNVKARELDEQIWKLRGIPTSLKVTEEDQKRLDEISVLERQANELMEEVKKMDELSEKRRQEIQKLEGNFKELVRNPEKSASFVRGQRRTGKN